ncbi:MAG: hypothetical protein QF569_23135 [Candidatus Poribacteria bacterium]|nr:hypothetical protein [Candidatus Poribacteria bacterium]
MEHSQEDSAKLPTSKDQTAKLQFDTAPSEAEENKPTAKLREVSQDQEPKLVLETVQGATAEAQLSLF